jgi:hypothetical protein
LQQQGAEHSWLKIAGNLGHPRRPRSLGALQNLGSIAAAEDGPTQCAAETSEDDRSEKGENQTSQH